MLNKKLTGNEKAGNFHKLKVAHTLIDWDNKTITHNYSTDLFDSEDDFISSGSLGSKTLGIEDFDLWINQAMKDATIATCDADHSEKTSQG